MRYLIRQFWLWISVIILWNWDFEAEISWSLKVVNVGKRGYFVFFFVAACRVHLRCDVITKKYFKMRFFFFNKLNTSGMDTHM